MTNIARLSAILLLILAPFVRGNAAPRAENGLSKEHNQFALDLYVQLRGQQGNLFFSPASISTAFAMAYAGARGQTAEQIARTLHFDQPADKLNSNFSALLGSWRSGQDEHHYRLSVANAFWGQNGYPFAPAFNRILQSDYGAAIHTVNFAQPEQARRQINQWVQEQTHDKIRDLMPSGAIDRSTVLALTNAIYFKAQWDHRFNKAATYPQAFKLPGGQSVQTPMMHQRESFPYFAGNGFKALEMSYAERGFSMLVLLPDQVEGLPALEKSLTAKSLDELFTRFGSAESGDVQVSFPKFKVSEETDLRAVMSKMGLSLPFSPQADFSGMNDGREPLFITAALHKAYVDVDEYGTEAAAATGLAVGRAALPQQTPVFNADHPFLIIIRDNRSGSILFMGRVMNPAE